MCGHYATAEDEVNKRNPIVDLDLDAVLGEFQEWLKTQQFTYRTSAEHVLSDLGDDLQTMGYADASDEVAALHKAVRQEKAADFERHAERLKEQLRLEIMARYVGRTEQITASLDHDPSFRKAVALLQDPAAYNRAFGR